MKKMFQIFKNCTSDLNFGVDASYLLGYLNRNISNDMDKAIESYSKACNLSNSIACNNLAWTYRYGKGIAKDESKAVELYQKACEYIPQVQYDIKKTSIVKM